MENVKLNFAHICDSAFLSEGGKTNIIGIFKNIFSQSFPTNHPKFSIVTSLLVINNVGNHTESFKIIREEDRKEISPTISVNIEVRKKEQEVNFIGDIVNIRFEKPGKHFVKVFFDDSEIISLPFDVVKIK